MGRRPTGTPEERIDAMKKRKREYYLANKERQAHIYRISALRTYYRAQLRRLDDGERRDAIMTKIDDLTEKLNEARAALKNRKTDSVPLADPEEERVT